MRERKGEKAGWTLGWCGGFLWVLILSIVFFLQHKILQGILGLTVVILALAVIWLFAPWKKPTTKFWILYLYPYAVFLISIVWVVWAYGGLKELGLNWWNVLWLLPMLTPIFSTGNRRWIDGENQP
ncbi:MAG: hypothetical protein ACE14Q_08245 [Acidobacteriota bacterium]